MKTALWKSTIMGDIDLEELKYSLKLRNDNKFVIDEMRDVVDMVDVFYCEMEPEELYNEWDNLMEILHVVKAYAKGFFEYEDVINILSDEYPDASWPWYTTRYICL